MTQNNNEIGSELCKAFPKKIQKLVENLVKYENYNEEYLLISLLSATSSAAGNAIRLRIKGEWVTHSGLYIMLVGLPGVGKSQPVDFAYRPIRCVDKKYRDEYIANLEVYEQQSKRRHNGTMPAHPSLRRNIISDFTPEALILSHSVNPRGITIYVDELMAMFASVNRYNNSPFIEQLLSAYSSKSLDVTRVSFDRPLHIEYPCINIIGTTQTDRIKELFTCGFQQNGLLDRFLFCYPITADIPLWDKQGANKSTKIYFDEWEKILNKIISIPFDDDEGKWKIISFTTNARDHFFDWRNKSIKDMLDNGVDDATRNRMMKTHLNVARIALAIQMLRWACGESKDKFVDIVSLKAGIQISDYFENCYRRIYDFIKVHLLKTSARLLYEGVGSKFTTAQALKVGQNNGMSVRNVKRMLTILLDLKMLKKISHGKYQKLINTGDKHP